MHQWMHLAVMGPGTGAVKAEKRSRYWCVVLAAWILLGFGTARAGDRQDPASWELNKVDSLKNASWALQDSDPVRSLALAREAVNLAARIGDEKGRSRALQCMSMAHRNLGLADSAVAELAEAFRISEGLGFQPGMASCAQKLGMIHTERGNVTEALRNLAIAERISRQSGNEEEVARTLNLKGAALETAGRYEEAIAPYFESLEIRKRIDSPALANSFQNLGSLYLNMGRTAEARKIFSSLSAVERNRRDPLGQAGAYLNLSAVSAHERRYDQVVSYVDSALAIYRATGNARGLADCFLNRAMAFQKSGSKEKARTDLDSALASYTRLGNQQGIAETTLSLATMDLERGDAARSLERTEQGLAIAQGAGLRGLRAKLLSAKADALRALGRYGEAVNVLNIYLVLQDSILGEKANRQLADAEMREKYDAVERIAQIQALEGEKLQERDLRERRTIQRNGLLVLAVLLLGLSILLYRNVQHKRKLAVQERQIFERRINELMHENEVKALNALLQGQETERQRIAKDLHDRLGSLLSAVKHQFSALELRIEALHVEQRDQYRKVYTLLDDAVEEVRRISHDMVKGGIAKFGLAKALEGLRESIVVKGRLAVELTLFGLDQPMERSYEIGVYRIVQELVSNALKHARPTELSIALTRTPEGLSVLVSDNGTGFDPREAKNGIGLDNARSRIRELGGTMQIDSTPKHGTTVDISIPVA